MKTNIKDLEVLEKYLSEDELKEVAKEVAYNAFKSSLGANNPVSRSNLNFFISQGAYEAVKQHITENDFREEEFVEELRSKVSSVIKGLNYYQLPLDEVIEEVVDEKKGEIRDRIDKVWEEVVNDESDTFNSLHDRIRYMASDYIQDYMVEIFEESLRLKFSKEDK